MNNYNSPHRALSNFKVGSIGFSVRENECIYYLVRGMTAKQIGKEMCVSPRTVEGYIINIKNKLNCASRTEIITKVLENGFPITRLLRSLAE